MPSSVNPILQLRPINYQFRSPYSFATTPGLPPDNVQQGGAGVTFDAAGNPIVADSVLTPYHSNTPAGTQPAIPFYNNGNYGDSIVQPVFFTGAGFPVDNAGNQQAICLPRPNNTRTLLLIQNNTIAALYYAFDRQASNVDSILITAGGSRLWDTAVPQGNLSLYCLGGGTVILEFMNNNIL